MRWATSGAAARSRSRCSAPYISGVSPRITRPPAATSRSAATPSVGFAVRPEYASLPPHCRPSTSSETGIGSRRNAETSPTIRAMRSNAALTVAAVPPSS